MSRSIFRMDTKLNVGNELHSMTIVHQSYGGGESECVCAYTVYMLNTGICMCMLTNITHTILIRVIHSSTTGNSLIQLYDHISESETNQSGCLHSSLLLLPSSRDWQPGTCNDQQLELTTCDKDAHTR